MVQLIELHIIITFTIVSLAGGGLGKVEEGERQEEEEENNARHLG